MLEELFRAAVVLAPKDGVKPIATTQRTLSMACTGVLIRTFGVVIAILLTASACGGDSSSAPRPTPPATPTEPTGSLEALVDQYWHMHTTGERSVTSMRYFPRQFDVGARIDLETGLAVVDDPGAYAGWDVLATRNFGTYSTSTNDALTSVGLSRSARVGIIWYGRPDDLPGWLQSWETGGTVTISGNAFTVFERPLEAGVHRFGGPEGKTGLRKPDGTYSSMMYTVLLAEEAGTPTPDPAVPEGREPPVANRVCPEWVHDTYMTTGPDGERYRTWHPQIDPVYWCYFGHEHGSDPATFAGHEDVDLVFDYFADKGGREETHEGFKVLTWRADGIDGHRYSYMHVVHNVSSSVMRACVRFHASDFFVWDETDDVRVAELHFKADYGLARVFDFDDRLGGGKRKQYIIRPDACTENAELYAADTSGRRNINVEHGGYETWAFDSSRTLFPFVGAIVVAFDNPIVSCSSAGIDFDYPEYQAGWGMVPCNEGHVSPGNTGVARWFNTAAGETVGFGLDTTLAPQTGEFYTDYTGTRLVDPTDPAAVRQYVRPGHRAVFRQPGKWFVEDVWTVEYLNSISELGEDVLPRPDRNLERSIQAPN